MEKKNFDSKVQCLSLLSEMIPAEKDDEIAYRSMVALGNCLYNDKECITIVKDLELATGLKPFTTSQEERLKGSAADLMALLA